MYLETSILVDVMNSDAHAAAAKIKTMLPNEQATFRAQIEELLGLLETT